MIWRASLDLNYTRERGRTVSRFKHDGPLRVLKTLYPEPGGIAHNILVHPPGGLVGGDHLSMQVTVGSGAHALISTPGATRFYRSEAGTATQTVYARLENEARLEWLPQETIAYNGCNGINSACFDLAPNAELMAWDVTALGLPCSNQAFEQGRMAQNLEIGGAWFERGTIDAQDHLLMNSPLGLAGQRCMGVLVFACGAPIHVQRLEDALACSRDLIDQSPLKALAGATQPHAQVIVVRVLNPVAEPVVQLLRQIWAVWRLCLWGVPGVLPRIWNV